MPGGANWLWCCLANPTEFHAPPPNRPADVLPFALDEGSASPAKPRSPAPGATAAAPAVPAEAPPGRAAAAGGLPRAASAGSVPAAAAAPAAEDADAAVGAFVRLIQGAPPLRAHSRPPTRAGSADMAAARLPAGGAYGSSSGSEGSAGTCLSEGGRGLSLQAGLRQFSRIKERLRQRGVVVAPCPAEA